MIVFNILCYIIFMMFGACIGSFVTMLTHRLPKKEEIIFTRSHCPKCGKELKIKSLIPIFSFIIQKGKCLECGQKISLRYLLIEIINSIAYGVLFYLFGLSFNCLYLCLLFSLILSIIVVDIEYLEIPMYLQFTFIFFAIIYILFNPVDPIFSMISAVVYFLIVELARIIVEKIKKSDEVLGGGDTKIITICGLFLTIKQLSLFFLIIGFFGCIFGLIWKVVKKDKIFPFAMPIVSGFFILLVRYYLINQ